MLIHQIKLKFSSRNGGSRISLSRCGTVRCLGAGKGVGAKANCKIKCVKKKNAISFMYFKYIFPSKNQKDSIIFLL